MNQTQIILSGIGTLLAVVSGYCFGRAHEIKQGNKAADRWYAAYQETLKRLHDQS